MNTLLFVNVKLLHNGVIDNLIHIAFGQITYVFLHVNLIDTITMNDVSLLKSNENCNV